MINRIKKYAAIGRDGYRTDVRVELDWWRMSTAPDYVALCTFSHNWSAPTAVKTNRIMHSGAIYFNVNAFRVAVVT